MQEEWDSALIELNWIYLFIVFVFSTQLVEADGSPVKLKMNVTLRFFPRTVWDNSSKIKNEYFVKEEIWWGTKAIKPDLQSLKTTV